MSLFFCHLSKQTALPSLHFSSLLLKENKRDKEKEKEKEKQRKDAEKKTKREDIEEEDFVERLISQKCKRDKAEEESNLNSTNLKLHQIDGGQRSPVWEN